MAPDTERGDDTKTVLTHEIADAKLGILALKRTVKRVSWVWAALGVIAGIFLAGVAVTEYAHRYVTQVQLDAALADIRRLTSRMDAKDGHDQSNDMMWRRVAEEIDDMHRYFRKLHQ